MITYAKGNLLAAKSDAIINTVNTVGIMGKGIALMFKEAFPDNFKAYQAACKRGEIKVGKIFPFRRDDLIGPKWIINFPTKEHWRNPSKIEWIAEGLKDLRAFIETKNLSSIAIPPLGAGNGKLDWASVRTVIERELGALDQVQITVFEPTADYQNKPKKAGVNALTPARAWIAELIRKYSTFGLECTILEVQKLAYFLERSIENLNIENHLKLEFKANKFGPYAPRLAHLLDSLDGSYLHAQKRLADALPLDIILFDFDKRDELAAYLKTPKAKTAKPALEATNRFIDGFQSPLGMELLATVDWLVQDGCQPDLTSIKKGLGSWPGGQRSAQRKLRIFDDRLLSLAIPKIIEFNASAKSE